MLGTSQTCIETTPIVSEFIAAFDLRAPLISGALERVTSASATVFDSTACRTA